MIIRRVNVPLIETTRLEKRLFRADVCAKGNIDPAAYRNLLRYGGERSRDSVIMGVCQALGLPIKDVVTITHRGEETA